MCVNFNRISTLEHVVKNRKIASFQRPMVCSQPQLRVKKRLRFFCLKKNKYLRYMNKYTVLVIPIPKHHRASITLVYG